MIVNVASTCGYTTQYRLLQELYDYYKEQLKVIAVPRNDFGSQEAGDSATIIDFCQRGFRITFPVEEKITIRHNRHPLYNFLCDKTENGICNTEVNWNYFRFLLNEKGITGLPSPLLLIRWINRY